MRHRIFIAINFPEDIKEKLVDYQGKWPELPIRWVKKENLHITLFFLGYLRDEEVLKVSKIAKEVTSRYSPFSINLSKICYGPPKKMPPRMVWGVGEKSPEFTSLREDLEKSLLASETIHPALSQKGRGREFTPHITLGRIRQWEWRKIEPEERPEVSEDISLGFKVQSIEVMESKLKREGAEYTVLETCNLKPET